MKPGEVAHANNPSTWEVKTGRSEISDQLVSHVTKGLGQCGRTTLKLKIWTKIIHLGVVGKKECSK